MNTDLTAPLPMNTEAGELVHTSLTISVLSVFIGRGAVGSVFICGSL
jgi:hypothetical protein